jgi:crotonobetainyl-CoA:carnitine CoA-transferase CaiB-like acyl-CoA transferase
MENFNLSYPIVKDLKEDIIMVSMPGYGLNGPWRDFPGFAFSFEQTSGLAHLTGYSDGEPMNLGAAADPLVGTCAAFSILAALEFRRQTGKGQFIELAQLEALTSFAGPPIIDNIMNNRIWRRWGNRNPLMAPHNVYPCKKNDTWVVIAVRSEDEWQAFCGVIGNPQWAQEGRFSTLDGRIENQEELDRLIAEWTVQNDPYEVMKILQKTGVPAGAVADPTKLDEEPHLKERGFWVEMDRNFVGKHWYASFPVIFSETPMSYRAAPTLGQDNEYVLGSILGLSKTDIDELESEKIVGTEPLQTGLAM